MSQGKIVSAIKVQKEFRRLHGKRITLDDAIKICNQNPYIEPIEGNNDKFKLKSDDEIKAIMLKMEEEAKEKDDE